MRWEPLTSASGRGLFEDTDLCYRIQRAGYRLRLASKAYVHHWGSRSLRRSIPDVPSLLDANGKLYREKWARDIETGYASHLPGFAINEETVRFDLARDPDKLDRELGERVKQADISLCMIVRNEERVLADCLRSAKPYFNQIVIVDTGSTDRTVEIAREFGAEVFDIPWPDSFAGARNESLKHARGKWVFWIDADDTVPQATGHAVVGAALTAPKDIAGFVVPVQFVEDGPGAGTRVDHVKLFRNAPGLAFEGRIHEQILASLRPHGEIARIDAVVMHSGYDTSAGGQAKKRERDWHLLALDLAERPNHPFVLFNYGMTHHFCETHEEAVEWLLRCLAHSTPGESHIRKTYAMLSTSHLRLGQTDQALGALEEGIRIVGGDPELEFLRAKLLSELARFAEAKVAYETMGTSIDGFFSSVDVGILGFKRHHNLASVKLALGDYLGARESWRAAIADNSRFSISAEALFDAALENGDIRTAREALEALYRAVGPDESWAVRGERLEGVLNGDEASEQFIRTACERHPRAPGPALCLCRRLCRTGREREADPMLRGLSQAGIAEAAFYLGVSAIRTGDLEAAVQWMRRSRDLDPANPMAQQNIEKLEAGLGPGPKPTSKQRSILIGPHAGTLASASKRFSIVIVTYNSARTLETCLTSLLPTLGKGDEVILVDNASKDETVKFARKLLKKVEPNVKLIVNAENVGYSKAANQGILASSGEFLVLLNPDTEAYPGWLEGLQACLAKGYAAVGPVSDRVSGDQFVTFYLPPGPKPKLQELPTVLAHTRPGQIAETRALMGFCLMVSRQILNESGLLFEGTALGADDLEFSWRLRALGYRLAIATDVFVRHDAGASFESLELSERKDRVSASDMALADKLAAYFGEHPIPSSEALFGSPVFTEALRLWMAAKGIEGNA